MANQSIVSIASTNHDDLCNWELINHFDVDFDTSVIVINDDGDDDDTIYDLVESFNYLSSTSSSSSDHDKQNQGLTIDHHHHHPVVDGDVRVSDLGENYEVSNCVGKHDEINGVIEYFNGSSSILYGHDDGHVNYDVDDDVNCFRVSNLGEDRDVSNYVRNHDKNDGVIEYFNGSNSILNVYDDVHANYDDNDDDVDDDGDDDDEDGYGIDDELVPWEVKDRLMRQRIRKSGKNSIGKLAKSKKSALVFTRPGCVRGKHGLGLKVY